MKKVWEFLRNLVFGKKYHYKIIKTTGVKVKK